jgi:hypothetical protein
VAVASSFGYAVYRNERASFRSSERRKKENVSGPPDTLPSDAPMWDSLLPLYRFAAESSAEVPAEAVSNGSIAGEAGASANSFRPFPGLRSKAWDAARPGDIGGAFRGLR